MARLGFTVDLERCVGCMGCVIACKAENGTPPSIHWMKVLEREEGEFPYARRTFTPVRCNHCKEPPCVEVCPTGASVQRVDGIVHIEVDKCMGCRYCMMACPYQARVFMDKIEPYFPTGPTPFEEGKYKQFQEGTVSKCHFCYHRIDEGRPPACVESCPADALNYGDLDDPESRVSFLLRQKKHFQPGRELGTNPSLFYLTGGGGGPVGGGG